MLLLSAALAAQPARLTLIQAQQEAMQNSPSLREGQARVREARYKVDEAYTLTAPTLQLQGGLTRITPPVEASFSGRELIVTPEYGYNSVLSLRQSLATFGRLHWAAAASELAEKTYQAELQDRRLRVLEDASLGFYEALLTEAQVQIAEDQRKARQAHLKEAHSLVKAGSAAPFDVKRDEAALANSEQQLLEAQTRAGLARLRLFTLLQRPDHGEELEAVERLPQPPQGDLSQALARRYDLAASRWGAEAARARVELAEAQDNPNLGIQTDYTMRTRTSFAPASQWTVGLNLQIPLFDGGLTEARANQAREVVEQLLALNDQAERNARLELNGLLLELRNRYQRLSVTLRNQESAQEAARIARLRYQNGLSTNVELLDSEAALTSAQRDRVGAHYQYLQTLARYRRAAAEEEPLP
jgi:outer membrane protein